MPTYRIVVTDITQYGSKFCVAGWDIQNGGMIRPEPPNTVAGSEATRFWEDAWVGPGKFYALGNVVQFDAPLPPADFPYPHATEDRVTVQGSFLAIQSSDQAQTLAMAAGSVSDTIRLAFDGHLVRANSGKAYVAPGQQTRSLGAVELTPDRIHLYEDNYQGRRKLRAYVTDDEETYDLSVPAFAARSTFLTDGAEALQNQVNACARIHLRLGLARAFAEQPCYAQVNGLYLL